MRAPPAWLAGSESGQHIPTEDRTTKRVGWGANTVGEKAGPRIPVRKELLSSSLSTAFGVNGDTELEARHPYRR
eukprot:3662506-Rhodomonas_salina.1